MAEKESDLAKLTSEGQIQIGHILIKEINDGEITRVIVHPDYDKPSSFKNPTTFTLWPDQKIEFANSRGWVSDIGNLEALKLIVEFLEQKAKSR